MADDYIGRKMEDYLASRQRKVASHRPVYGVRPGTISVPYTPQRIFITSGTSPHSRAIIEALRHADCRVAFCDTDTRAGTAIAQQTGSRFYPLDNDSDAALAECMQRVLADFTTVDILIDVKGTDNHIACRRRINIRPVTTQSSNEAITLIVSDFTDSTHIGRICVFLTEPAAACISDGLTMTLHP